MTKAFQFLKRIFSVCCRFNFISIALGGKTMQLLKFVQKALYIHTIVYSGGRRAKFQHDADLLRTHFTDKQGQELGAVEFDKLLTIFSNIRWQTSTNVI